MLNNLKLFTFTIIVGVSWGVHCPGSALSDEDRNIVLKVHNDHRSKLAKGLEPKFGGGHAPSAKEMYKLRYDCEIEKSAQAHADLCKLRVHSRNGKYGENLYSSMIDSSIGEHLKIASEAWWGELERIGIMDPGYRFSKLCFGKGVGHFTQMAWYNTTKIGCGYKRCERHSVVCQYEIPGNVRDQLIYPTGRPCQSDGDCKTIAGSVCEQESSLCIDPETQKVEPAKVQRSPGKETKPSDSEKSQPHPQSPESYESSSPQPEFPFTPWPEDEETEEPVTTPRLPLHDILNLPSRPNPEDTYEPLDETPSQTKKDFSRLFPLRNKRRRCFGKWSQWSAWKCTDRCGSCGTRVRTRECLSYPQCRCRGYRIDGYGIPCNSAPCEYPRKPCCLGFERRVFAGEEECALTIF